MLCRPGNVNVVRHPHIVFTTKTKVLRCAGTSCQMIRSKKGYSVAYERSAPVDGCGTLPALLFCNGLLSDRSGKKACLVRQLGIELGCEVVLYDARAHGETPGNLADLGIDDWLADAQLMLDEVVTSDKVVVIGSSLGAWVASLLAVSRPARVAALLLIAPAIDISEHHWAHGLTAEDKRAGWTTGLFPLQSPYVSTMPPVTPQQTVEMSPTAIKCDIPNKESCEGEARQQQDNTSTTQHEPGAVMMGLQFFVQGSRSLLLHEKSQFELDWKQQSGTFGVLSRRCGHQHGAIVANECTVNMIDKSSTRGIPELMGERLKSLSSMPLNIIHGTEDDCVPIGLSFQFMQALDNKASIDGMAELETFQNWMYSASSSGFDVAETNMKPDDMGMVGDCLAAQPLHVVTRRENRAQQLYVIEGGDHRLSGPAELQLLRNLVTNS